MPTTDLSELTQHKTEQRPCLMMCYIKTNNTIHANSYYFYYMIITTERLHHILHSNNN